MNTVNPIDKFRQDFFDKVIQQEKEATAAEAEPAAPNDVAQENETANAEET